MQLAATACLARILTLLDREHEPADAWLIASFHRMSIQSCANVPKPDLVQWPTTTVSSIKGVGLEAAMVEKGLCQDLFSPDERQMKVFRGGHFLSRSCLWFFSCRIGVYA